MGWAISITRFCLDSSHSVSLPSVWSSCYVVSMRAQYDLSPHSRPDSVPLQEDTSTRNWRKLQHGRFGFFMYHCILHTHQYVFTCPGSDFFVLPILFIAALLMALASIISHYWRMRALRQQRIRVALIRAMNTGTALWIVCIDPNDKRVIYNVFLQEQSTLCNRRHPSNQTDETVNVHASFFPMFWTF